MTMRAKSLAALNVVIGYCFDGPRPSTAAVRAARIAAHDRRYSRMPAALGRNPVGFLKKSGEPYVEATSRDAGIDQGSRDAFRIQRDDALRHPRIKAGFFDLSHCRLVPLR